MSKKVYLTNAEVVTANLERIRPLMDNVPFEIRDRLGLPFIHLTKEKHPRVFSQLGVKIWGVKEDGLRFNVQFALSGSVTNGVINDRPKKGGVFNFSIGGWTSIDVAADRNPDTLTIETNDIEVAALSTFATWTNQDKNERGDAPALWWDLNEATTLVLVPYLDMDCEVYVKDSRGRRIPDGKGGEKTELRDFIKWSFGYWDCSLHGKGMHGLGLSAADLASVDPDKVLRLV